MTTTVDSTRTVRASGRGGLLGGRLVQVGISTTPVCGVRDHADVLAGAFQREGTDVSTLWHEADPSASAFASLRRARLWLLRVRGAIDETQPHAIILHYSVFAFGPRGLPVLAPLVARALAGTGVPVLGMLHEFAYPFGRRGWRGALQALSHRVVLVPVVRSCAALVVTTESRVKWVQRCRWLPRRPVVFAPVFSSLPCASAPAVNRTRPLTLGVVGFASPDADVEFVAESVHRLVAGSDSVEVVLIGAPGPIGGKADEWRDAFGSRGCGDLLRFTGLQGAADLAQEIARVDLVLFPDRSGPGSRRAMLAAVLAAGKAVLAFDGPERWDRFVSEGALVLICPDPEGLAAEISRLRVDPARREAQGARAADFYRRSMAPDIAVARLSAILPEISADAPVQAPAVRSR